MSLMLGYKNYRWPAKFYGYSWIYLLGSIVHVAFVTSDIAVLKHSFCSTHNIPAFITVTLQSVYTIFAYLISANTVKYETLNRNMIRKKIMRGIFSSPSLATLLPVFIGIAFFFGFNFEKTILTLIWVGLTAVYLSIGLLVRSKKTVQIATIFLVVCCIRLVVFDLVQSDLATRASVFLGVGGLMLGISILYKKYKKRIELNEKV